jgi:hypothetical protein
LFTVNQYYKNEWLGRVPSETVIKAATKDTTSFSIWNPFTSSSSFLTVPTNFDLNAINISTGISFTFSEETAYYV